MERPGDPIAGSAIGPVDAERSGSFAVGDSAASLVLGVVA
jgi:hypothetical protein